MFTSIPLSYPIMNVVMWGHSVFWGAVRRWVIQEQQTRERMLDGEMVSSSSQVWGKRREEGGADLIPETQILGRKAIVLCVHPRASWPWRWGWELTRAGPWSRWWWPPLLCRIVTVDFHLHSVVSYKIRRKTRYGGNEFLLHDIFSGC